MKTVLFKKKRERMYIMSIEKIRFLISSTFRNYSLVCQQFKTINMCFVWLVTVSLTALQ